MRLDLLEQLASRRTASRSAARVQPDGKGALNPKGSSSIAALRRPRRRGIESMVTLYHWDFRSARRRRRLVEPNRATSPTTALMVEQFGTRRRDGSAQRTHVLGIPRLLRRTLRPGHRDYDRLHRAPLLLATDRLAADATASPAADIGSRATARTLRPRDVTRPPPARIHGGERLFLDRCSSGRYPDDAPELNAQRAPRHERDLDDISAPITSSAQLLHP